MSRAISATTSDLPIPGGPHKKIGRLTLKHFVIALRACTEVTVRCSTDIRVPWGREGKLNFVLQLKYYYTVSAITGQLDLV